MPWLYEVWPARNRFCCKRMLGPASDTAPSLCWYICAALVVTLYSIFVLPTLWNQVTPALPVIFYLSVALTTVFYNLTACTDPGVIPRRPILEFMGREEHRAYLW